MVTSPISPTVVYTRQFYERLDSGCRRSAERVVPMVVELVHPESVVDIGCGTGAWLAEFRRFGVREVLGVDGAWVPKELLHIAADEFTVWDFNVPLHLDRQFDLVVSLEVAEHLPESSAEAFVVSLTSLGPVILFSAAVPGQGGDGHVNEKPLVWWEALFASHGYWCHRNFGAQFANDRQVEWWYSRNMVFFIRGGQMFPVGKSISESPGLPGEAVYDEHPNGNHVRLEDIQPVVMTCALTMPYVTEFVASYLEQIGDRLPQPVVVVDLTASNRLPADYLSQLMQLSPVAMHVHPRVPGMSPKDSVNGGTKRCQEPILDADQEFE